MRYTMRKTALLTALSLLVSYQPVFGPSLAAEKAVPPYLTSATYFSNDWPINFWNSESRFLEEELKQISQDGFNSIILVLPWREFQPDVKQPGQFNTYPMEKLDRIMKAADELGLWVTVRLGYTWDYYEVQSPLYRYEDLLKDPATRDAWLTYAATLYETLSGYPNFYGGFITWEDFWNFTENSLSLEKEAARKKAAACGYTDYLKDHYTLGEIEERYGESFSSYREIYLPKKQHLSVSLFYEFYDDFLNNLLEDTQKVFPDLSMEVRLDQDPYYTEDGQLVYYNHNATYSSGSSPFVSAMTSVAMGQVNQGETIEAQEGVQALNSYLNQVTSQTLGKKLYIEQFLYMDTTPEFSHNAQVLPEQVPSYILGMAPVLQTYSMGYGLWVYRNYGNNQLYNPQFALGLSGWSGDQNASVVDYEGSPAAKMERGQTLRQTFRSSMRNRSYTQAYVKFRAIAKEPCDLTITLGRVTKTVKVDGDQVFDLDFGKVSAGSISFQAQGVLYLDDVNVYTEVQDARLYDMNGNPLDCIPAVRQLNAILN